MEPLYAYVRDGVLMALITEDQMQARGLAPHEEYIDVTGEDPEALVQMDWRSRFHNLPSRFPVYAEVAKERINREAGACRSRYITVIPGQESTYLMKEQEARAYPGAGPFPMLEAEAEACGATVAEIATLVIQTATQWRLLAAMVEGVRRGAILAVERATTVAEVDAVRPTFPG